MAYNSYIIVPLATWAVAQISKFALAAFKGKIDFRYLYASGGMPSVHSAVVCSLATTAFLVDGGESHLFGMAAILAGIIMYDSFGVRRSSGEQAVAINMLIESLDRNRVKLSQPDLHLREILGHQPREVAAGAILGVVLGGLFNYDKLASFTTFLQETPSRTELYVYLAMFIAVLLAGVAVRLVLRGRHPKSKTIKKLTNRVFVATQTVGWLGLVSLVLVYEKASYFVWRLWPVLIILLGAFWAWWLATASYKMVPAALAEEAEQSRKLRWLNWGKGRRKSKRA